jgi:hypothetical protein
MRNRRTSRPASAIAAALFFGLALSVTADEGSELTDQEGRTVEAEASSTAGGGDTLGVFTFDPAPSLDDSMRLRPTVSSTPVRMEVLGLGGFGRPTERAGNGLFATLGVGIFAASAGDLASTELGLTRLGAFEANPLQRNRMVRVSSHLAVPALVWWTSDRLHARGKTKLALAMRIGFTIAYGYATLHNSRASSLQP